MSDVADQSEPNQNLDLDSYKDMSVGQILQKTREYYGKTLPEVEGDLRIRASQLDALEKLKLEKLPGRVYAIGFVRAYSEYLGLDGDKMVHLFKAQSVGKKNKPSLNFPVTYDENNTPSIFIILVSIIGLVLLLSYWTMFKTPTKYVEAIPPVPEILQQSTVDAAQPPPKKEPMGPAEPEPVENRMELVITQDSWVEIKNADGKKLISQVLKKGDKYIVPEEGGLILTTGNAGGVTVMVDGKERGKIGKTSQVKRNVALDPDKFTQKAD